LKVSICPQRGLPAEFCKLLGKKQEAVMGVAAAQAKITWLVSGATVLLNFRKKSIPRIGPATAA
jgi:hypothetical protein